MNSFARKCSPAAVGLTSWAAIVIVLTSTVACSSIVRKDTPTISHIHIGHAITGWPLAPRKQGLLVVAELASIRATANSARLLKVAREGDLDTARELLQAVIMDVDPVLLDPEDESYGLRKGAAEAITHLRLASEIDDSSANVQRTVTLTSVKATDIVDRTDELTAFLDAGLKAGSVQEMEIIAEEIQRTLTAIAGGPDAGDVYGLYEFRDDIERMVERENPPYQTVDSWYLFNLVQLPDGNWAFASRRSRGAAGVGY